MLFCHENYAACRTDGQDMTHIFPKCRFNGCLEIWYHVIGDKGLNGTRKTTAMDTYCTTAFQNGFSQCQCNGHILMLRIDTGVDIL